MPHDLGIAGPREQRKDEYIGKRSLFTPVANDKGRKQFVGLSVAPRRGPAADRRARGRRRRQGAPLAGLRDLELYEPDAWRPVALGLVENGLVAHGRNGRRLSSRRGAARDDRIAGRARSGRKAAPCVR